MRDEHDCAGELCVYLRKQIHDMLATGGIKLAGRLVGEQQLCTRRQRSRDRDALLLATRQPSGYPVGEGAQPEPLEQLLGRVARRPGGEGHVLPDGRIGKKVARRAL